MLPQGSLCPPGLPPAPGQVLARSQPCSDPPRDQHPEPPRRPGRWGARTQDARSPPPSSCRGGTEGEGHSPCRELEQGPSAGQANSRRPSQEGRTSRDTHADQSVARLWSRDTGPDTEAFCASVCHLQPKHNRSADFRMGGSIPEIMLMAR